MLSNCRKLFEVFSDLCVCVCVCVDLNSTCSIFWGTYYCAQCSKVHTGSGMRTESPYYPLPEAVLPRAPLSLSSQV